MNLTEYSTVLHSEYSEIERVSSWAHALILFDFFYMYITMQYSTAISKPERNGENTVTAAIIELT